MLLFLLDDVIMPTSAKMCNNTNLSSEKNNTLSDILINDGLVSNVKPPSNLNL
jgi:hypothetical protein